MPTAFKLTGKMMQRGGVQKLREKSLLLLVVGRTVYTSLSAREVRELVFRTKVPCFTQHHLHTCLSDAPT